METAERPRVAGVWLSGLRGQPMPPVRGRGVQFPCPKGGAHLPVEHVLSLDIKAVTNLDDLALVDIHCSNSPTPLMGFGSPPEPLHACDLHVSRRQATHQGQVHRPGVATAHGYVATDQLSIAQVHLLRWFWWAYF